MHTLFGRGHFLSSPAVSERTSSKSGSSRKSGASTLAATARSRAAVNDSKPNPKKKIRRGRKPGKTKNQRANSGLSSFLYANGNGYRSKKESINQIIEEHDIDVIVLNETKVYSKSAIKIKGFRSFLVVRNKNKGGGAFIGVRHGLCEPIMIDCGDNAEFLTVRLCNGVKGMQIILA